MTRRTYSPRNVFPSAAFRKRLLPAAIVAAGHLIAPAIALAGPEGGNVVAGSGSITKSEKQTTITQRSDRLIAEWDSFDLASDEVVTYLQPGRDAVALNRILSNSASNIRGRINANGHVVLINPRGIVFGESAQVNVGGIIASGLDIANEDFLNGDFVFSEVANTEGKVINQGMITAATGGNVVLQGKSVKNEGLISAHLGSVNLASGRETVVTFDEAGLIGVRVTRSQLQEEGSEDALTNAGSITAEGGRVLLTASTSRNIFSQAVNTGELAEAKSVLMHEDGSFTLGAGGNVSNTGTISASGDGVAAGQVALVGENVTHTGEIFANATNHGTAGTIELHSRDTTLLKDNSVTESRHDSGEGGQVYALGNRVGVADSSHVNVSGAVGGGTILVGGDYKGENQLVRNSQRTFVGQDTLLNANANTKGDGGEVIVWSDEATRFYGHLTAKGAGDIGRGGFAEVSGKDQLLFRGDANLSGAAAFGTLLLDPKDIEVSGSPTEVGVDIGDGLVDFSRLPDQSITINNEDIASHLETNGNLVLTAHRDISIHANIDTIENNTNSLTLRAGDDVTLGSFNKISLGKGDLNLYSGSTAAHTYCETSSYSCMEGAEGQADDQIAGRSIWIEGSIDTEGDILLKSGGQIKIDGSIGQSLSPSSVEFLSTYQTTINGAVTLSAPDTAIVGDSARGLVVSAGDESLSEGGDKVGVIDGDVTNGLSTDVVVNSAINTQGRVVDIGTPGAVWVHGDISTGGGNFTVGSSVQAPSSFSSISYDDTNTDGLVAESEITEEGLIDTSSSTGGGIITIHSMGDVTLGQLAFGYPYNTDNNNNEDPIHTRSGGVTVTANGDITFSRVIDFNDTGPRDSSGSSIHEDGEVFLDATADGDIRLNADTVSQNSETANSLSQTAGDAVIFDLYGDGRDALNINLTADADESGEGGVSISGDVYTSGGNFTATGHSLNFLGAINTRYANALKAVEIEVNGAARTGVADWSTGGEVDLTARETLALGNVVTIATCQTAAACTGNFSIRERVYDGKVTSSDTVTVSQNDGSYLDVSGVSSFTLGSGSATLSKADNIFSGGINLISAQTVTLNSSSDLVFEGAIGSTDDTVASLTIGGAGSVVFTDGQQLNVGRLKVEHSGDGDGVLEIRSGENAWTISGDNAGYISTEDITDSDSNSGFTFSGFTNLTGGAGGDDFTLTSLGSFSGAIDGGEGTNSLSVEAGSEETLVWQLDHGDGVKAVSVAGGDARLGEFSNMGVLTGTGADTFYGRNQNTSWTRESKALASGEPEQSVWTLKETGDNAVHDLTLMGMSNLTGGDANDHFTITSGEAFAGTLRGGQGADTLTVEANTDSSSIWHLEHGVETAAVIDGTADPEVVRLSVFEGMETLEGSDSDGGTGSDTLHGRNERTYWEQDETDGSQWALSTNENSEPYIEISGMTELVGGEENDSFVASVNHDSRITLRGGAGEGNDTLNLSALESDTVVQVAATSGEQGDVADANWLISDITGLTGVGGNYVTTLRIPSSDTQWTIDNENAGFVEQEEPTADEGGSRLFSYTLNFSGVNTLVGGSGDDTFTFRRGNGDSGALTGGVDGGEGSNQLVAGDVDNVWFYHEPEDGGNRAATLGEGDDQNSAETYLDNFVNIQRLKGGTGADQFILSGAAELAEIDGGEGGGNSLAVEEDGTNIWTLNEAFSGDVSDGKVASFLNVQSLSGSGDDTLKGRLQNNDWLLSGPDAGSVEWWNPDDENATATDRLMFDGMSTLEGRSESDRFTLEQGASFAGSLVGTVSGEASAEGSEDSLLVEHDSNTWSLTELHSGSVEDTSDSDVNRIGSFSSIQTLTGSGDDRLRAPVGETNYSWQGASGTQWTVTNTETNETLKFSGMSSLVGSNGNDTFTPISTTTALQVDGGEAGTDTLNLAAMANQTVVVGESTEGTEWQANNLTNLTGSADTTTLKVTSGHNSWLIDGDFEGEVAAQSTQPGDTPSPLSSVLSFSGVTHLVGGSGEDSFTIQPGAVINTIEGGSGSDELAVLSNEGDTVDWGLNQTHGGGPVTRDPQGDDPEYDVVKSFSEIESLTGGDGNDQFSVDGNVTFDGLVDGGAGETNDLDLSGWDDGDTPLSIGFGTDDQTWNIAGINSLTGRGENASLSMAYGTNSWTITGENAGTIQHSISGDPGDSDTPDALFSGTLTFSGFGNLNGGSGEDKFVLEAVNPEVVDDVAGSITGTIDGGGSDNTITVAGGDNTWNLDHSAEDVYGIERNDAPRLTAFSNIQALNGSGSDVLNGKDETTYWSSDTNGTWTLSTSALEADEYQTVTGMSQLFGGTGADTFTLGENVSYAGTINGGSGQDNTITVVGGDNIWNLDHSANNVSAVVKGGASRLMAFSNIQTLNGSSTKADIVNGTNDDTHWRSEADGTWKLYSSASEEDPYLTLIGMGALFGGTGADTFTLGENVSYAGTINGGSDLNNTLTAVGGDNTWKLDHIDNNVNAIVKDDVARLTAFNNIQTLNGADSDRFYGKNEITYWRTDTNGTWSLSTSALAADQYLTVTGMSALFGGTGADTFTLGENVSYAGTINGGSGLDNTLTVVGGDNTWNLDHSASGVYGIEHDDASRLTAFSNIQTLNGSNANADIVNGTNDDTGWRSDINGTWDLYASGEQDPYLTLIGMDALFGGTGADTFTLGENVSYAGTINGGSGLDNTLTVVGGDNTWNLDHSASNVNAIVEDSVARLTAFSNIQTLNGSSTNADTVNGTNDNTDWRSGTDGTWGLYSSASEEDPYLTLVGMGALFGGTGADTFTLGENVSYAGTINGGSGLDNTLTMVGGDNTWNLDHSADDVNAIVEGGVTRLTAFSNIQTLNGSDANADIVNGTNENTDWRSGTDGTWELYSSASEDEPYLTLVGMGALFGGTGADTFTLGENVSYAGTIDGGSDLNNTLTVVGGDNTWNLDHSASGVYGIERDDASRLTAFSNIQTLNGSSTNGDIVNGTNENTDWRSGTDGTWELYSSASEEDPYLTLVGMGALFGGTGADAFTLGENVSYAGSIDGGSGLDDTITVVGGDNIWNLDHSASDVNAIVGGGESRLTAFSNIQTLNGSDANADIVNGTNENTDWRSGTDGTWELYSSASEDEPYLTLVGMGALFGGTGADTFTLGENVSYAGTINGGSGLDNTLTMVGGDNTWNLDHSASNVNAIVEGGVTRLTAFSDIQTLNGSSTNADIVNGTNENTDWRSETDGTWELYSSASEEDPYLTLIGMGELFGGTGEDTFTLGQNVSYAGSIDGGSGLDDTITVVGGDNIWNLDHSASDVNAIVEGGESRLTAFSNIQTLNGSDANADIVNGTNDDTYWSTDTNGTWDLSTSAAEADQYLTVTGMSKLLGGTGSDTFTLESGTDFNGTVEGGTGGGDTVQVKGGGNVWRISGYGNNRTDGINGQVTSLSLELSAINVLTGAAGDRLTAPDEGNNWTLTGADAGTVVAKNAVGAEVSFSGMSSLIGGTGEDQFTVQASSNPVLFAGLIDGGAGGADSLNLEALSGTAVTVGMLTPNNNASSWQARTDDDVTIRNIEVLSADSAANNDAEATGNKLLGPVSGSYLWTLTGENSGRVERASSATDDSTLFFSAFEFLEGGNGENRFVFINGGGVTGGITGGGNSTWLDYSQVNGDLCIDLLSGVDGCGGPSFSGIDGVIGNGGVNANNASELRAAGSGDYRWTITKLSERPNDPANDGINDGEFTHDGNTIAFIDFNHLVGGSGTDEFSFNSTARLTGSIDGRGGADLVSAAGSSLDMAFRLRDAAPENSHDVGVWLKGVETITANADRNYQLIGDNRDTDFVVTGEGRGHLNDEAISFSGIAQLWGGTGGDTFTIEQGGGLSSGIIGGDGDGRDSLRVDSADGATLSWSITGAGSGTVGGDLSFDGLEVLNGGLGNDQFTLNGAEAWVDNINASSGENTLSYSADDTDPLAAIWTLSGARNGSVTLGNAGDAIGFTAIGDIQGSGRDWLSASDAKNTWTLTSANGGTLEATVDEASQSLIFDGMTTLEGNVGVDHFSLNGTNFAGTLLGGSGDDLVSASGANTWALSASGNGVLNTVTRFESIKTLNGGGDNNELIAPLRDNQWTLTGAGSGTVNEEGAATESAMTFTGMDTLTGNDQMDRFSVASDFTAEQLQSFAALNGGAGAQDALNLSAMTQAVTLSLGRPEDNQETEHNLTIHAFVSGFESLAGAVDLDNTLLGASDRAYRWRVTGNNRGQVEYFEGGSDDTTVAFVDFANLTGGSASDTFTILGEGGTSGVIDGGRGVNLVDYSQKDGDVEVIFGGLGTELKNINGLIGNNAGTGEHASTLLLGDTEENAAWRIGAIADIEQSCTNDCQNDGVNDGRVTLGDQGSLYFIDFNVLKGSSGADTFTVADDGRFIGFIDGGAGGDTLDISDSLTAQTVGLTNTTPYDLNRGTGDLTLATTPADTHLVGVETLTGSNARQHVLYAQDTANTWSITDNGGGVLNGDELTFSGVQVLHGGSGSDQFTVTGDGRVHTLNGGLEGESNTLDISGAVDALWLSLDTDSTDADIRLVGMDELTGSSERAHRLQGDNRTNRWAIDGRNGGTLNEALRYSDITILQGNAGNDVFSFAADGRIDGYIDGGSGGENRVDLSALPDTEQWTIATTTDAQADLNLINIQTLDGRREAEHTLLGTDEATDWTITNRNSGTLGDLSFTGVANLVGGLGSDDFVFNAAGELSGYIDGGAGTGENTVNLSSKAVVAVSVGTEQGDLRRFDRLTGNNRQTTLTGLDDDNRWRLESGENAGQLNDRLRFTGVTDLVGGDGGNTFSLNGGLVTGSVTGGAGEDRFDLVLGAAAEGDLRLNALGGDDELLVSGGGSGYQVDYFARRSNGERLTYTGGSGRVFEVVFEGIDRVQDDVTASELRLNSSLEADSITLENNSLQVDGLTRLEYRNKSNLTLAADRDDSVVLNGAVSVPGRLEIRNASVRQETNDRLEARELHLVGVSRFGAEGSPIYTDIDRLYANVGQGGLALDNQSALNLVQLSSLGDTEIYSSGNITSTANLSAAGELHLQSELAGIRLEGENHFAGTTHLEAAHDIDLNHDRALTLGEVRAQTLTLNNSGDVSGNGAWTLDTAVLNIDGNLDALNRDNRIGELRVENAGNVALRSARNLNVAALYSDGDVELHGAGLSLTGAVEATNLTLEAGDDALVLSGAVDIDRLLQASASDIMVERGLTAGRIDVSAQRAIDQRAELRANADINLEAGGALTMSRAARTRTDAGTIRYRAGDDLTVTYIDNPDGTIALVSDRRIETALGTETGLRSQRIEFEAVEGIGTQAPLALQTRELHAVNRNGTVTLSNEGELRIERLASNGDIVLRNAGTVELDNREGPVFDRGVSDAIAAGGITNANYDLGTVRMTVTNGNLLGLGAANSRRPDLVGRRGVFVVGGDIGSAVRPLVMYFQDSVTMEGIRSWRPYWAFDKQPETVENNSAVQVSQDFTSAGEQLVEVEGLEEIDPAIFTEVRNYTYDEVSILMPPDQRYTDDDDDERYSADY